MKSKIESQFKKLEKEIKNAKKILLLVHRAPDGDAIGSLLAFNYHLKKKRKKTYIFSSSVPKYLDFLMGYNEIKRTPPRRENFDLILALDYADAKRIDLPPNFSLDEKKVISIDHHASGERIGKIKIISAPASSVCEMIYYFFRLAGQKIDRNIATYLLAGIFTDTVGFTRLSGSKKTKEAIVELLRKGADIKEITGRYSHISLLQARVLEKFLSRIKWDKKVNLIYSWISYVDFSEARKEIYKEKKYSELFLQEPPVFPDFLAKIGNANIYAFLVKLKKNKIKVSLRAANGFDVAKISEKKGGGGHKEAAGFFIKGTLKEAISFVKEELKKQQK